jgi:hypothetical protein
MEYVSIPSLWLPIVLSAIVVFVASSLIHMVFGYHANDIRRVPDEDELMAAFRKLAVAPGDYGMPKADSMAQMKDPAYIEKIKKGPLVFMTVAPGGDMGMGKALSLWFVYITVVTIFAAYIASRALHVGSPYLSVFRFVGATAFMGYSLALAQQSIWYRRNWGTTFISMVDGLIFALLSAGVFGWLWPR